MHPNDPYSSYDKPNPDKNKDGKVDRKDSFYYYGPGDPPPKNELVRLLEDDRVEIDARATENGLEDVVGKVILASYAESQVFFKPRGNEVVKNANLRRAENYEREVFEEPAPQNYYMSL